MMPSFTNNNYVTCLLTCGCSFLILSTVLYGVCEIEFFSNGVTTAEPQSGVQKYKNLDIMGVRVG